MHGTSDEAQSMRWAESHTTNIFHVMSKRNDRGREEADELARTKVRPRARVRRSQKGGETAYDQHNPSLCRTWKAWMLLAVVVFLTSGCAVTTAVRGYK